MKLIDKYSIFSFGMMAHLYYEGEKFICPVTIIKPLIQLKRFEGYYQALCILRKETNQLVFGMWNEYADMYRQGKLILLKKRTTYVKT